jgi:hypothetical protein
MLEPSEKEDVMVITNEFEEAGVVKGLQVEALSFAQLLLRSQFPDDAVRLSPRLESLSVSQLEQFGVALLKMWRSEEAERWLAEIPDA